MNAYVAAAVQLAGALAREGAAPALLRPPAQRRSGCRGGGARSLLVLLGADVVGVDELVRAASAAFVAVYAPRLRRACGCSSGAARWCAGVALAAVAVVLAFSGVYVAGRWSWAGWPWPAVPVRRARCGRLLRLGRVVEVPPCDVDGGPIPLPHPEPLT